MPGAPKKMLWVPKFFVAAPNTSHVGLLTSWLLALWTLKFFFGKRLAFGISS